MHIHALIRKYLNGPGRRLKTRAEVERILTKYVSPALGDHGVDAVDYDDVASLMDALADRPVQANRVLAHLSTVFVWAIRWKLRTDNPCQWVPRFPEQARNRYSDDAEENRIRVALGQETDQESADFLLLLALTGARVSELARARFEDWQPETRRLVVGEGKNGDERVLYLCREAEQILRRRRQGAATAIGGPIWKSGVSTRSARVWRRVRAKADCPDLRRHDLRHSFAAKALSAGCTLGQVGELLGHRSVSSTKRYVGLVGSAGADLVDQVMGGPSQ